MAVEAEDIVQGQQCILDVVTVVPILEDVTEDANGSQKKGACSTPSSPACAAAAAVVAALQPDGDVSATGGGAGRTADAPPAQRLRQSPALPAAAPAIVLDICLDFFSVHNPFKIELEAHGAEETFCVFKRLYEAHASTADATRATDDPSGLSGRRMDPHPVLSQELPKRQRFIECMKRLYRKGAAALAAPSALFLETLAGEAQAAKCPCTAAKRDAALLQFRDGLRSLHVHAPVPGMELNPERLEDIGSTVDLPHHQASEAEVAGLLRGLAAILKAIAPPGDSGLVTEKEEEEEEEEEEETPCAPSLTSGMYMPALVTIARSEDDGYTPHAQAAQIEDAVLQILGEQFGDLDVVRCKPWRGEGEREEGEGGGSNADEE